MEKTLRDIIDSLDDGILLLDDEAKVLFENKGALAIFRKSVIGEDVHRLIPSSRLKKALAQIHETRQIDEIRIIFYKGHLGEEARLYGKGREQVFSLRLARTEEESTLLTMKNVTKEERLNMVRQDFIANASHELKTPLTAIVGFSETIKEENLSAEELKFFANIIHKNSTHMEHILTDLLLLTNLDRSEILESMERINIRKIISEVVSLTVYKAQSKNIRIEMDIMDKVVLCNESLIVQALTNLVVNAINYSSENKLISIRTTESDNKLYISVKDEGCGIDARDQVRIFERFYRVDKARSRASGGTGLGLSIVRHIAILHGGTITVESEIGKGSEFTLRLPIS